MHPAYEKLKLVHLTITETRSIKPRRSNRNSQGAQRSWEAKHVHVRKASNQIKPNEVNQPTNNQSIDRSISQANNTNQTNATTHIKHRGRTRKNLLRKRSKKHLQRKQYQQMIFLLNCEYAKQTQQLQLAKQKVTK